MENRRVVKKRENHNKENNSKNTETELYHSGKLSASRDGLFSSGSLRSSGLCPLRRNLGEPDLTVCSSKISRGC
ncbi:MAG TPA: hypothetical protein VL360_06225 [Gammaproteobacteria bacterium]|jgi:hypothetical protein|nr:hypothetical protein [Gammaproteobacteria bacterium]